MKQTTWAKWLRVVIVGAAACAVLVYAMVIPRMGRVVAAAAQGAFDHCYWPWLIFLWVTGIPCAAALVCAWKIAGNIGANRAFSRANAKLLWTISLLAVTDAVFFFAGNIVFLFLDMNHPSVVLLSLLVVFLCAAIAVAGAALSHLVMKAADLQDQSDWTI